MFCSLAGDESVPADVFSRLVQDQTLLVLPVFGSGDHYRVTLPTSDDNQPILAQLKPFGVFSAATLPPSESPALESRGRHDESRGLPSPNCQRGCDRATMT